MTLDPIISHEGGNIQALQLRSRILARNERPPGLGSFGSPRDTGSPPPPPTPSSRIHNKHPDSMTSSFPPTNTQSCKHKHGGSTANYVEQFCSSLNLGKSKPPKAVLVLIISLLPSSDGRTFGLCSILKLIRCPFFFFSPLVSHRSESGNCASLPTDPTNETLEVYHRISAALFIIGPAQYIQPPYARRSRQALTSHRYNSHRD